MGRVQRHSGMNADKISNSRHRAARECFDCVGILAASRGYHWTSYGVRTIGSSARIGGGLRRTSERLFVQAALL